jgi:cell wall-associated NlpC family hydrolase
MSRTVRGAVAVVLTVTTALALVGWGSSAGAAVAPLSLQVGARAWVSVSVATLWRSPGSPRPVDAPALANPARIRQWLTDMTLSQRRALNGHADTQALLGDQVRVVRLRPGWAKVVVPSQPSQLDARGYPGWVPRRQLTARLPESTLQQATVVRRTAWLRTDRPDPARLFRISFGTRLPVVGQDETWVRVVTPDGAVRRVLRSAAVLHRPGEPALPPSTSSLTSTATAFVGLPYLWAGLSGFGLDCSGLTWLDYRVHGITIPRDALPQSRRGAAVTQPGPGDLMFYATAGRVHHVSMYLGNGRMVQAPHTGSRVEVVATSQPAYSREYAGARRYYAP